MLVSEISDDELRYAKDVGEFLKIARADIGVSEMGKFADALAWLQMTFQQMGFEYRKAKQAVKDPSSDQGLKILSYSPGDLSSPSPSPSPSAPIKPIPPIPPKKGK